MFDFYTEYHSLLASTAAIVTVLACVLKFIYHAVNRRIRKIATLSSTVLLVIWIAFLLMVFMTSSDPIERIDIVSISALVYLLMTVVIVFFVDLEKVYISHQTKQKYDLFTMGNDEDKIN